MFCGHVDLDSKYSLLGQAFEGATKDKSRWKSLLYAVMKVGRNEAVAFTSSWSVATWYVSLGHGGVYICLTLCTVEC